MNYFNTPWQHLIYAPLIHWGATVAPRGMVTREQLGWRFTFLPNQRFIHHPRLPLNFDYLAKELAWYVKGEESDISIAKEAEIWNRIIEKDGKITSNYGYLLWGHPEAPLERCLHELRTDSASRRAFAHILRPSHFGHDATDVPCTVGIQFLVRDGRLFMAVTMRSQDAVYGLRNDLPFFHFVGDVMSRMLNLEPPKISLSVGSFHIYERHFDKVREIVRLPGEWRAPKIDWTEEVEAVCERLEASAT